MEPSLKDALKQAALLARRGESERARLLYRAVLARAPEEANAKKALAALERRSADFEALTEFYRKGDFAAIVRRGPDLLRQYPGAAFLHNILGGAHAALGQWDEASTCYKRGLSLRPDIAEAHVNLGKCLSELGRAEPAIACFASAIRLKPQYADAHFSLGIVLGALDRDADAVRAFSKAVAIRPDFAEAYNYLGIALYKLERFEDAVRCAQQSLRHGAKAANTYTNLGAALYKLGRPEESIAALDRALALQPDIADVRAQKAYQQALICDWRGLAPEAPAMAELGISGSATRPFVMLPFDGDPARQRARAERFAKGKFPQAPLAPLSVGAGRGTLRIGYFSANFHDHPVMQVMARLFERHDQSRFQVHGYSFGPPAKDAMRARAQAAMDVFHDVRGLRARQIAELARSDGIAIAVDLMGYTENARSEIFAYRAAPIQIAYLGYPGTMGAPFIDYLIADRTLVPKDEERHYSENLILLPDSTMPGDESREIAASSPSRAELGLPDGFVFCCFNNSYKISPEEFDIWMRLLRRIEGSVLWLSKLNPWAVRNLRKEAEKRGVGPERLVFAERVSMAEHLARHAQAGLFLDTFRYNAHSTAIDALWAGLPVVTRPGRSFAARVGASLLTALDLPELIAASDEAYESLALALACDPERLSALKAKLWQKRRTARLFDSQRFARHLEAAYREAFRRYREGETPGPIVVN